MDDPRIKDIVSSGKTCYFISPHYDDMAYSAGALATELAKTNRVIVITLFTSGGKRPYTRAAKQWMSRCGYDDADIFFADRKNENQLALKSVADEIIDLGFADAPWRGKPGHLSQLLAKYVPELGNIRGSLAYRYHAKKGNPAEADHYNFNEIRRKLRATVSSDNSQIFGPLGVGKHFDHLMTRAVCDALFSDIIYWEDYPYILKHTPENISSMRDFIYAGNRTNKQRLIEAYSSQYYAMFGSEGPHIVDEHFYYRESK